MFAQQHMQESWTARPDTREQWSHCAVVPLYVLAKTSPASDLPRLVTPLARSDLNWETCEHWTWSSIRLTVRCVSSPRTEADGVHLRLDIPGQVNAELVLPEQVATSINLPAGQRCDPVRTCECFTLKSGAANEVGSAAALTWLLQLSASHACSRRHTPLRSVDRGGPMSAAGVPW